MLWTEEMFKVKKPIIAMLHLDPLPGDPRYRYGDCMETVAAHAREDLRALQEGGVDGVLFSNEFSLPYQRHMSFVTPAAMARVIGELKSELAVPYGVDCISDGAATLELAAAVDAKFVRGTFCGVYVGDGGLYDNDFSALLRRKAALHLDELKMLYFINPESDRNLDTRPLADIASSTIFKAHPDGLCISASAAGQDVDEELMAAVKKKNPEVVVLCNTGCRPDTIAHKLSVSDAAVVGTTFKEDGKLENEKLQNVRVKADRVKAFMEVVYKVRAAL
ncbi:MULTISPECIES: BtpA/SgcQ family protein [unclassified Anaerotruncus]|jgi:membrane complex biogenesis BtpA family protein|uniref:BtpA/SgcQ family protein n=1 Tax=unclassified Anaerotruncus TaxID=2641626 RepID=UPI000340902C|nr:MULTISPECIES: BtpA/SgcQ family protein [unclassified Anaerotruncus]MCI8942519.1 BtpA/SgcQ family protein [Oscillospiraceae bacterium]NCE73497.1 SgcQ protein [Anaerotruncus sp. X29]RKJ88800.1 SgcQ protein [Anaerotruncus sp. 1XD22-93]EOS61218.1 BtpA family membrane complex biogenesis protein [Anaerotruncus sp. G3(2012)]NBK18677.1 SgcQ protein [Anaerotruncus sp. 1XD42-93]